MAKEHLKLVTPATVKRTVAPKRLPNRDLRTREHLTEAEVERLMDAARGNRHGNRDATMVLLAYRLRASELVDLRSGIRWTSERHPCTSAGPSRALPARIRSLVTNSGCYGGSSANSSQNRPTSSRLSGARHLPPLVSPGWSSEQGLKPSSGSRPIRTC
jgi:hypothetical protein